MTPWRKQAGEFEKTDGVIHEKPGLTAAQLAHELGVARSTITRRLPSMELAGYLYTEDERGGLWPFGRRKR